MAAVSFCGKINFCGVNQNCFRKRFSGQPGPQGNAQIISFDVRIQALIVSKGIYFVF
ncbi:hypothetical protein SAMN05444481_1437 [Flavobacterium frigidimaris]|nr:hypothetical protein SAMN05444481_1437 [Flavobacterium frigidimaris]